MLHLDRFITGENIQPVNITIVTGADAVESALDIFSLFLFYIDFFTRRFLAARFFESRAIDFCVSAENGSKLR